MGKEQDWRDRAREIYRAALAEMQEKWSGPQKGEASFLKEELQEALLDLKQAVIDDRKEDADLYGDEVNFNLAELRRLLGNS